MNWLFILLMVFIIIAAILLVIVVLLQSGKGDGMASNFVSANQVLGVRQAAGDLEKATWYLVAFILVLSIISAFTFGGGNNSGMDLSEEVETVQEERQPEFPAVLQEQPASEVPVTELPAE